MSLKERLGIFMVLIGVLGLVYSFTLKSDTAEPVKIYENEHIKNGISTLLIKAPEGLYRVFVYSAYQQGGITAVKIR